MNNKNFAQGFLHLVVVYIIWGSTYLAMRITVRAGSGFEVFSVGWTRLFIASVILFIIAVLTKRFTIPKRKDLLYLALTGCLMWVGGHGLILWSEKYIASAYAALFVGSAPLWTMIIESWLDKKYPKPMHIAYVMLGFIGLIVLIIPNLDTAGFSENYFSIISLMLGTISWILGFIIQKRLSMNISALSLSTYQHFFGAIGFFIISLILGEKFPTNPSTDALFALGFLIIFGSVIAFTSFIKALKILPSSIVITYAYVNPVIAMILGYFLLKEKITIWALIGGGLILGSVIGTLLKRDKEAN